MVLGEITCHTAARESIAYYAVAPPLAKWRLESIGLVRDLLNLGSPHE